MIKKIILLGLLVIVLVSLNWFKSAFASDLQNLSDEDKVALIKKYQNYQPTKPTSANQYKSAEIYENDSKTPDDTKFKIDQESINDPSSKFPLTQKNRQVEFEDLKPFGFELFAHIRNDMEMPVDISSSSDYILGPGDNVIIYLWGRVEKEFNLTIDREGKVFIPQVGEIVVWGLSLENFIKKAQNQFSKVYSDFDLTVSLGKIRSIRIYVAGEVNRPGAYTVSSLTSILNALYLAGGPTERGTMRSIKLMRNGKAVSVVDLYKLLMQGDNSADIQLRSGDVVFIPVSGPQVAIRGEIRRPAIYELIGNETASELLSLAGNPTPEAHLERIMLERISDNDEWNVIDLNLKEKNSLDKKMSLTGGDRLTIFSVFEAKQNIVAVFGKVKHAGYFERNDTTHISDIINRAKLQPYDVYYDRVDIFRRHPDRRIEIIPINLQKIIDGDIVEDILLQDRDSIHIYSIEEIEWDKYVYIEGEIKNPGRYPLYENMTVNDLIFLSGSFTRSANLHRAEIARIDSTAKVSLEYVRLAGDESISFYLNEDDHLYIRQIPEWEYNRSITISGAVKYPGKYTLSSKTETLYQLLQRVGGFIENSFPEGILFERTSIRENLKRLRVGDVIKRSNPIKLDSLGQIVEENKVSIDSLSMNRIIIDMKNILATEGKEGDIILEPNDKIYIPTTPSGISILGAVGANGTLKYREGLSVKDYISSAGSFTKQADKKQTRLIRATGEVLNGGNILKKRVNIGDVIIVPSKIEKERNLLKTFTTALSAATGVLTSVYIISKL